MKSKTKRPHMKEVGTERCGHICPERMCTNMKGCLDWEKEGHSVRRHETSRKRHPQCAAECPRYSKLQRHSQLGKGKSRQTVELAMPTCEGLEDETDVDPPSHFNTLDLAGPSNVAGPSQIFSGILISFHCLFVFQLIDFSIRSTTTSTKEKICCFHSRFE